LTVASKDVGLDTAILRSEQLSDKEWEIVDELEQRLAEVKTLAPPVSDPGDEFKPHHLAFAEDRRQRVLLLDGGRGTGKTSFLLTLINRWNRGAGDSRAKEWPLDDSIRKAAPDFVRVIRNLDFDPLPHSMPLLAGIVHAWRPVAEYYDVETFGNAEIGNDDEGRRLMDAWHTLFRVAAAGWSELPRSRGLIEEVLDREEQVRDWQYFREHWVWFVDEVIRAGKRLKGVKALPSQPAFVIVIDDVDLQVERARELLPALRLLAHDNVFFLVAADLAHLTDMLVLDFFGQQQRLASIVSNDLGDAFGDRWSTELARAAVQKVFPIRNRWRLAPLTLTEMLRYPQQTPIGDDCSKSRTIHGVLDGVTAEVTRRNYRGADKQGPTKAGDAVTSLAKAADDARLTLTAGSYRSVQQLWQTVSDFPEANGGVVSRKLAAETLARLVSPEPGSTALVVAEADDTFSVQVTTGGELAALYLPGPTDRGGADDVVVSARPEFVYIPPDDRGVIAFMSTRRSPFDFTAGLIAKTLQELAFPVDAASLTWNAHLTLAWTAWHWSDVTASFAWPWHTHPRPDELLERTARWATYLAKVGGIAEQQNVRERHAYAWVYYECEMHLRRLGLDSPPPNTNPLTFADKVDFPWDDLLMFVGAEQRDDEVREWTTRTLPLLLRPEIGLRHATQRKILPFVETDQRVISDLYDQRRQLATNAVVVASLRRGKRAAEPSGKQVDELLQRIENYHRRVHNQDSSLWYELIETRAVSREKSSR
jgi:hypothetical protein